MNYSEYKKFAKKEGVDDLERDEWERHVKAKPNLSAMGALRRIKNERSQSKLSGYVLGTLDHITKNKPFSEGKAHWVYLLDGKEWKEVWWNGSFSGKVGKQNLITYEETDDGLKIGRTASATDKSFNPKTWGGWQRLSDLEGFVQPEGKWPILAITGKVSRFLEKVTDFEGDKLDNGAFPSYPLDQGPSVNPCVQIYMRDGNAAVEVNFGPYRYGELLNKLPDFNLKACENLEEFNSTLKSEHVGIIGTFKKLDGFTDKQTGDFVTKVEMRGFAIFSLDEAPAKAEAVEEPESEEPDDVEDSSESEDEQAEQVKKLREGCKLAIEDLGKGLTPLEVKEGGYVPDIFGEDDIEAMLKRMTKKGGKKKAKKYEPLTKEWFENLLKNGPMDIDDVVAASGKDEEEADEKITEFLDSGLIYEPSLGVVALIVG